MIGNNYHCERPLKNQDPTPLPARLTIIYPKLSLISPSSLKPRLICISLGLCMIGTIPTSPLYINCYCI